jgi:hypothetical protein
MPRRCVARYAPAALFAFALAVASCGSRTNLGCETEVAIVKAPPTLYFVLDRSTSMRELGKWGSERSAISALIAGLGAGANFGAAVFPPASDNQCAAGEEVMPPQAGVDQPTVDANPVAQAFLTATSPPPLGGTPTAKTLEALLPELSKLPGHTFVVLATDGGPNCNPDLSCPIERCTSNIDGVDPKCQPGMPPNCCSAVPPPTGPEGCLDDRGAVAAAAALEASNIPVFVIGVPGSAPYAATLDEVAIAGGEARAAEPYYYRVDSADQAALSDVLAEIVVQASRTCDVKLATDSTSPLEVSVGGAPVAVGAPDGWTLAADIVSFHGASCQAVLSGASVDVKAYDECRH